MKDLYTPITDMPGDSGQSASASGLTKLPIAHNSRYAKKNDIIQKYHHSGDKKYIKKSMHSPIRKAGGWWDNIFDDDTVKWLKDTYGIDIDPKTGNPVTTPGTSGTKAVTSFTPGKFDPGTIGITPKIGAAYTYDDMIRAFDEGSEQQKKALLAALGPETSKKMLEQREKNIKLGQRQQIKAATGDISAGGLWELIPTYTGWGIDVDRIKNQAEAIGEAFNLGRPKVPRFDKEVDRIVRISNVPKSEVLADIQTFDSDGIGKITRPVSSMTGDWFRDAFKPKYQNYPEAISALSESGKKWSAYTPKAQRARRAARNMPLSAARIAIKLAPWYITGKLGYDWLMDDNDSNNENKNIEISDKNTWSNNTPINITPTSTPSKSSSSSNDSAQDIFDAIGKMPTPTKTKFPDPTPQKRLSKSYNLKKTTGGPIINTIEDFLTSNKSLIDAMNSSVPAVADVAEREWKRQLKNMQLDPNITPALMEQYYKEWPMTYYSGVHPYNRRAPISALRSALNTAGKAKTNVFNYFGQKIPPGWKAATAPVTTNVTRAYDWTKDAWKQGKRGVKLKNPKVSIPLGVAGGIGLTVGANYLWNAAKDAWENGIDFSQSDTAENKVKPVSIPGSSKSPTPFPTATPTPQMTPTWTRPQAEAARGMADRKVNESGERARNKAVAEAKEKYKPVYTEAKRIKVLDELRQNWAMNQAENAQRLEALRQAKLPIDSYLNAKKDSNPYWESVAPDYFNAEVVDGWFGPYAIPNSKVSKRLQKSRKVPFQGSEYAQTAYVRPTVNARFRSMTPENQGRTVAAAISQNVKQSARNSEKFLSNLLNDAITETKYVTEFARGALQESDKQIEFSKKILPAARNAADKALQYANIGKQFVVLALKETEKGLPQRSHKITPEEVDYSLSNLVDQTPNVVSKIAKIGEKVLNSADKIIPGTKKQYFNAVKSVVSGAMVPTDRELGDRLKTVGLDNKTENSSNLNFAERALKPIRDYGERLSPSVKKSMIKYDYSSNTTNHANNMNFTKRLERKTDTTNKYFKKDNAHD